MPETRLLAQHQPRATTLSRAQPVPHPGANATGSFVSASPAAGGYVQAQAIAARHAAALPPNAMRPPGTRPQDARVALIQRPGASGGQAPMGHGGTILATNQRPTVQIIPKVTPGQVHTQVPPGGGVPFDLDEAMLVGQLLNQYVEAAIGAKDDANAQLGSRALGKISANVHILMEMIAQAQTAQAAQAAVPQPTRVQIPAHPTMPPMVPSQVSPGIAAAGPPTAAVPPGWPMAWPAPATPGWPPAGMTPAIQGAPTGPVVVPAWPANAAHGAPGTPAAYPWPPYPVVEAHAVPAPTPTPAQVTPGAGHATPQAPATSPSEVEAPPHEAA